MSAIDRIHKLVRPGESVKLTLSGEDDRVCVVIEPHLEKRADESDSVPERAQLLAVLSQPIRFHVRHDECIDTALAEVLDRIEPARAAGYSALDELLASLSDASAGARNRAASAPGKKTGKKTGTSAPKAASSKRSATAPDKSAQAASPASPESGATSASKAPSTGLFD